MGDVGIWDGGVVCVVSFFLFLVFLRKIEMFIFYLLYQK